MGELSDSFEYGLNAAATEYDGENKYIRITDIDDESRRFIETDLTSPKIDLSNAENYKLKIGDIIFARTGASVGKSYIYNESDGLVYYAGFLIRTRIKPEYNAEFVFQSTLTSQYNDYIRINSQRSGQPGVNAQEYAEFSFLIPEFDEQCKLGTFFRNLDNLLTLHQREREFLYRAYFGKISKIEEITPTWEQRKLGDVVDIRGGRDYKHLSNGDIPVYGTGGYMLSVNEALSYDEDAIGIGRKGTIDKPYILNAPFWTVDTLFYAVPRDKYDLNFVFDIFQTIDWKKKDESTGVPSLSKTAINSIEVRTPNYQEQKIIGNFFATLDNLITLHQREYEFIGRINFEIFFSKSDYFTSTWEQRKFSETFIYLQNNSLSRADLNYEQGLIKNVHYGDVLIKFGEILDVELAELPFISNNDFSVNSTSLLQNGDVIIADAAEDETVGKCSEIKGIEGINVVSGLHTIPCRPNKTFASGYLGYYLNSSAYHDQLLPLIQGTKISSISKSALLNTDIIYPDSEQEQLQIGQFLQSLDNLITLHQRKPQIKLGGYVDA